MQNVQAEVHLAPSAAPGIPPSSLMAFLRVKPSLAGVVLADFGSQFRNPFYQGRLDANISTAAVVSAAAVAARALHAVAWDAPNLPPMTVRARLPKQTPSSSSLPWHSLWSKWLHFRQQRKPRNLSLPASTCCMSTCWMQLHLKRRYGLCTGGQEGIGGDSDVLIRLPAARASRLWLPAGAGAFPPVRSPPEYDVQMSLLGNSNPRRLLCQSAVLCGIITVIAAIIADGGLRY